jgi:hypothetical protein
LRGPASTTEAQGNRQRRGSPWQSRPEGSPVPPLARRQAQLRRKQQPRVRLPVSQVCQAFRQSLRKGDSHQIWWTWTNWERMPRSTAIGHSCPAGRLASDLVALTFSAFSSIVRRPARRWPAVCSRPARRARGRRCPSGLVRSLRAETARWGRRCRRRAVDRLP